MEQLKNIRIPKRCQRILRREGRELLFFPLFLLLLAVSLVGVLQYIYKDTLRDHIFFVLLPVLGFVGVCRFGYVGLMGYHAPHRTQCGKLILQQAGEDDPIALEALMDGINRDLALHGKKVGKLLVGQDWMRCGSTFLKINLLKTYYWRQEQDWRSRTVLCFESQNGTAYRVPGGTAKQLEVYNALQAGLLLGVMEQPGQPVEAFFVKDAEL